MFAMLYCHTVHHAGRILVDGTVHLFGMYTADVWCHTVSTAKQGGC